MMKEPIVAIMLFAMAGMLAVLVMWNDTNPSCFEDEALTWDGRTNDHTLCVPIDDIVDRGIEYGIQNGVLEFTDEWRNG